MQQYRQCLRECRYQGLPNDRCCVQVCCFQMLEIITFNSTEDYESGNVTIDLSTVDINWRGLVNSFLLSVGDDPVYSKCHMKNNDFNNSERT